MTKWLNAGQLSCPQGGVPVGFPDRLRAVGREGGSLFLSSSFPPLLFPSLPSSFAYSIISSESFHARHCTENGKHDKVPTLTELHVMQKLNDRVGKARLLECLPQLGHLLAVLFEQVTLLSVPIFLFRKCGYWQTDLIRFLKSWKELIYSKW